MKRNHDIVGDGGSSILEQVAAQRTRTTDGLAGVRHLVAVGSGKGGVGKSTLTLHLAGARRARGLRIAILDADLNGPSQARWDVGDRLGFRHVGKSWIRCRCEPLRGDSPQVSIQRRSVVTAPSSVAFDPTWRVIAQRPPAIVFSTTPNALAAIGRSTAAQTSRR